MEEALSKKLTIAFFYHFKIPRAMVELDRLTPNTSNIQSSVRVNIQI